METRIIAIYTKEEDIKRIAEKLKAYSFDELKKDSHFDFSLMEKMTDINEIKKIYSQFNLIKSIELRENEKKKQHYSFNYELEDGTFAVISITFDSMVPKVINGFHASRSYKHFERSLRKNYSNEFR